MKRNALLAIFIFFPLFVARVALADDRRPAVATVNQYLNYIDQFAPRAFTEDRIVDMYKLMANPDGGSEWGYYVYTQRKVDSCSTGKDGTAHVIVRYQLAGEIRRDKQKPKEISQFHPLTGAREAVFSYGLGKINQETPENPFYPPIVGIQDYEERKSEPEAEIRKNIPDVLNVLNAAQQKYLQVNAQPGSATSH